jgi:uncharacterized protein YcsI (UPF0317 family)
MSIVEANAKEGLFNENSENGLSRKTIENSYFNESTIVGANAKTQDKSNKLDKAFEMYRKTRSMSLSDRTLPAQLLNKSDFVSFIFGMKIKLAGRIMSQGFRARYSVSQRQKGYIANSKSHVLDVGRFTGKNKRGAFSISVKINHDDHLNK